MLIQPSTGQNIQKARRVLRQGGVIIYPTDTLYGLGADIFNKQAIEKVFRLKGREFRKPISVMVSSLREIKKLAWVNKKQERFISAILPGPFTILLKKKSKVPKIVTAGQKKVGLRIPNSKVCQQLSKNLPITSTSANISGFKPTLNIKKIARTFNHQVDLILADQNLKGQPSIVIDLTEEPFEILRF
ncbi:threonylcarbamoyl-AMP synthase [Patescibacteria group bacterium]|nr:threonylcarbamoyl-AMP synthase [Patescibacteria group bacterium]